jgi:hypothetical protein
VKHTFSSAWVDRLAEPWIFGSVVLGYYACAWLVRVFLLSGTSGDEAELMLYSQHLALTYDIVNPPVAGWIGWLVERAVGPGLGGALLVRYGLLSAFFILFHAAARALIPNRKLALAAAIAPVGFWFLGWESLRNYMDSLAMIVALAASLLAIARIAAASTDGSSMRMPWLAFLAVAVAFGALAKYNFIPAFLLLAVTAACVGGLRPAVARLGFWVASGLGVLMAVPVYLSAWRSKDDWLAAAEYRLMDSAWNSENTTSFLERLLVVPDAAAGFVLPMLPLMVLLFHREIWARLRLSAGAPDAARWLWLYLAVLLVVASLAVAAFGVERLREHYMFVLIPLPIALAAALPGAWVRGRAVAGFVGVNCLLALVALGVLAAHAVVEPMGCTKCRLTMPWSEYASGIKEIGFERGTILAFDNATIDAGPNLRRYLPGVRVWSAKRPYVITDISPSAEADPGSCLLVWNDDRTPDTPYHMKRQPVPLLGRPLSEDTIIGRLEAPLNNSDLIRNGVPAPALGYAFLPEGAGACF